jgi:hypothetical protein
MLGEIIGSVVGAVAKVAAALIQRPRREGSTAESVGVMISEPRDGAIIEVPGDAPRPNFLPISGRVSGIPLDKLRSGLFRVEVIIRTDALYPQGRTTVGVDGQWHLRDARFGGDQHDIQDILINPAGHEVATTFSRVTVHRNRN